MKGKSSWTRIKQPHAWCSLIPAESTKASDGETSEMPGNIVFQWGGQRLSRRSQTGAVTTISPWQFAGYKYYDGLLPFGYALNARTAFQNGERKSRHRKKKIGFPRMHYRQIRQHHLESNIRRVSTEKEKIQKYVLCPRVRRHKWSADR
jgi:hypothetical protein